jgi:rubrerythrin
MPLAKIDFEKLNLQDALDLAVLIEQEAFERYTEFAEQIGHRYDGDSGDFFKTMAGYEAEHAAQLKNRREKLYGKVPSRVNADMIWDIEAPGEGAVRSYMSPKQAMEVAMESEVKAYNFFDKALAFVKDTEVKKLFEELRAEENQHKELLKKRIAATPESEGPDLTDDDVDEPGEF